jgi:Fe2+ or Zn2+ uptake regulation protein
MESKRNTEQKRVILQALKCADHPTASQLYESVKKVSPRISRATVFRVLSQFADDGTIRRLEFLNSDTRFDANPQPHAHCHCIACGKVVDVFDDDVTAFTSKVSVQGFTVFSTEVEFNGLCPECALNNKACS